MTVVTARLGRRLRRRRGDEAGTAMLLVVMCLLVAMTLSTALLGNIMSETVPTAYEAKSARTVQAAEAGLQAATSLLRAAVSSGQGDVTKLPCLDSGSPLTGTVGGSTNGTAITGYSVTVRYYTIDPAGQSVSWRAANAISCVSGSGPASKPLYALIQARATATGGAGMSSVLGNRSLELVYQFRSAGTALGARSIPTPLRVIRTCAGPRRREARPPARV